MPRYANKGRQRRIMDSSSVLETEVVVSRKELAELVSKGTMEQDNRDFNIKVAVDSAKALLSIIELHKPLVHALPDETCWACQDLYPCPTIQAIEKALV